MERKPLSGMEEGVVVRKVLGYNGHHRLEKFYNILSRPTTDSALTSQHDVTPSLTSIKATKENVLKKWQQLWLQEFCASNAFT